MKIKLLNSLATLPTKADKGSAGFDLYAATSCRIEIPPHETVKIETGIAVELPEGTFGAIYARSGIATKRGLRPGNCCGIVDSSFRSGLIVALHNDTEEYQYVEPKERIAQLIVQPYLNVDLEVVEELSETERGAGGFGSSGRF